MRNLLILIFISSFLSGCLTGNNTFKTTENSTFKTIKVKELTKQEKNTIIKEKEWEENTKIRQAALKKKLEADVELARSDLEVFLNNPIGVAEHIDYVATAEKKLEYLAHAEDKLETLVKHFSNY